jgi:glycosyltransferase involved in cell wall biosynthesis
VGDGPERASLEANAILGRTYFAGAQTDTPPWYRAIDVFVLPSLSEALSNSLLEAQACGCRAIASNVGGNSECVETLFPVGDSGALAELLRVRLGGTGNRATSLPQGFTIARMRQGLEDIYA